MFGATGGASRPHRNSQVQTKEPWIAPKLRIIANPDLIYYLIYKKIK